MSWKWVDGVGEMMRKLQARLPFWAMMLAGAAAGCGDSPSAQTAGPPDAVQLGRAAFRIHGCMQCHTADGTPGIGPSLRDVYGTERPLDDGRTVLADRDYLRRSIIDHGADIVEGFPNVGPAYFGQITVEEVDGLVAFLQSISRHTTIGDKAAEPATPQPEPPSKPQLEHATPPTDSPDPG